MVRIVRFSVGLVLFAAGFCALSAAGQGLPEQVEGGIVCRKGADRIEVTAVGKGVLRVRAMPGGVADAPTPVLDPSFRAVLPDGLRISAGGELRAADGFRAVVNCEAGTVELPGVVKTGTLWEAMVSGAVGLHRSADEPVYGIRGIPRFGVETSLARPEGGVVKAGAQGNAGGPFFFSRSFGFLVDSVGGEFQVHGAEVVFRGGSRKTIEFFLLDGPPLHSMRALADLTGHAPMPPKWTLGFLNSQWGIDEAELKTLVHHYRASHIPLDGFILDYDWKAWGEDNYGEWRWNSTSGAGNAQPDKFPDGASGALAKELAAEGVHLAGILKPRIMLYKEGTHEPTEAARYAEQHGFWYGIPEKPDNKNKQPTRVIDFSEPEARTWFWKHLQPSFEAGMVGWWNDEADEFPEPPGQRKTDLEFFHMGQSLYEGQRASSDVRVWSLNRNFYLGAQRFGYAEWSGDIKTGQASMASQPTRMLVTLNLGEPHWSMDTGGFIGNPTPEEYARWVEFASLTPIARVHARYNQKRQPWIYGPVTEAAATKALKLRYSLMPYLYSAERTSTETGIGMVRPLEWIFPDDPEAAAQVDEWMLGDALLAAPVLELGGRSRRVYLPKGMWYSYADGTAYNGNQTIALATDGQSWQDIPLFVKAGSIVATEEPGDSVASMKPVEIALDVFPPAGAEPVEWTMYDDDGATYGYEHGNYFQQTIRVSRKDSHVMLQVAPPKGAFKTSVKQYVVRLHVDQRTMTPQGWLRATDRFGTVLERRWKVGEAHEAHVTLQ